MVCSFQRRRCDIFIEHASDQIISAVGAACLPLLAPNRRKRSVLCYRQVGCPVTNSQSASVDRFIYEAGPESESDTGRIDRINR
jgi:hypothetical protein